MAYLTPETIPATVSCRYLIVPDSPAYLAIVRGALMALTFPESWTKYGALTPQEAADSFLPMFNDFCFQIECGEPCPPQPDPEQILMDWLCEILIDALGQILEGILI